MFENKQKFSIKKLTIGLVSVLLGFSFIVANVDRVSAKYVKSTIEQKNHVKLDYNYLDYDDLTSEQKSAIIKETPKDVSQSEKVYYF